MPAVRNRYAREARDKRIIDLYAAGTPVVDLAKQFNLSTQGIFASINRYPKDLDKAVQKVKSLQAAVYRRGAAILSRKLVERAENMNEAETRGMRASDASRWASVVSEFEKNANLAEGLATERIETTPTVTIIVKTEETAKAISNGISGGAIKL